MNILHFQLYLTRAEPPLGQCLGVGGGTAWAAIVRRGNADMIVPSHSREDLTRALQGIYGAPVFMELMTRSGRADEVIKQIKGLLTGVERQTDCDFETMRARMLEVSNRALRERYDKLRVWIESTDPGFVERGNRPGWGTYKLTHEVPCTIKFVQRLWELSPWKARGTMKELNDRGLVRYTVNGRRRSVTTNGEVHHGGVVQLYYGIPRTELDAVWEPTPPRHQRTFSEEADEAIAVDNGV